jgi:hypothetical protein
MADPMRNSEKAVFVRKHPKLSSQQVVDLAAKRGIDLTVRYVQNARWRDRKAQGVTVPRGTPGARNPEFNKAEWIRQHQDLPAREILALAVQQGIKVSASYIGLIRSRAKNQP